MTMTAGNNKKTEKKTEKPKLVVRVWSVRVEVIPQKYLGSAFQQQDGRNQGNRSSPKKLPSELTKPLGQS